jgi:hypothetical protein
MRWSEIHEALQQALPLRAGGGGGKMQKAKSLIPPVRPPMDPGTAIASALPQVAQAVAAGEQQAIQQAVAADDAQEVAQATKQAQIQQLRARGAV